MLMVMGVLLSSYGHVVMMMLAIMMEMVLAMKISIMRVVMMMVIIMMMAARTQDMLRQASGVAALQRKFRGDLDYQALAM